MPRKKTTQESSQEAIEEIKSKRSTKKKQVSTITADVSKKTRGSSSSSTDTPTKSNSIKKEIPSDSIEVQSTVPQKRTITTNKTYDFSDPCPCGSGFTLGACCGQYFDGIHSAPTPEALLRSRYTAHVTHHHSYLIDTTHSAYKKQESEADITKWIDQLEWKGFTILTSVGGKKQDTTASIAFIAHFRVNGIPQEMRETAHFIKEDGKWFYTHGDVEGHITYTRTQPKIGRNDPCPCGSGKKYKKCCLLK